MQDKYVIGEKEYTREELLIFGKQHYPKFYMIKRGVGLGVFGIFGLMAGMFIGMGISYAKMWEEDFNEPAPGVSIYYVMAIIFGVFALAGLMVFFISFVPLPDENYIKHAIDYYTKLDANTKAREARLQRNQANANRKEENKDISQLLKYKELLDAGIITQEEFDAKKKELL